jgi:hypothetical protein
MYQSLDNPSLAMASNAYRRRYGAWPEWVRFAPGHFGPWAADCDAESLILLASVFDVSVTSREQSPRLTVGGPEGEITYNEGVTEADWDSTPFDEWLNGEANKLSPY